jgi:hypothetical protein
MFVRRKEVVAGVLQELAPFAREAAVQALVQ